MHGRASRLNMFTSVVMASHVRAQRIDVKCLRIDAPFLRGGPVDSLTRILAASLTERYKQSVEVENFAGSACYIGIEKVRRAKHNGQTLLVVPARNTVTY